MTKQICSLHACVFEKACPVCEQEMKFVSARNYKRLFMAFRAGFAGEYNFLCRNDVEREVFAEGVSLRCEFVLVRMSDL